MRPSHRHLLLAAGLVIGACSSATPPTAPTATPVAVGASPPAGSGALGKFIGVGHTGQGSVTFTAQNGDSSAAVSVGHIEKRSTAAGISRAIGIWTWS